LPRDLEAKPTEESVRELYDWVHSSNSGWDKQRTLDTLLIDLIRDEHAVEVQDFNDPKRKNRLKPERMSLGEAARTVDVMYNLHAVMPRLGFQWFGTGERNPEKSDKLEIAMGELMDQLNPPTDSPWKRQTKQLISLGREACFILPGSAYWSEKYLQKGEDESEVAFAKRKAEWTRKAPIPILWRDLPAESTFPPSMGAVNELAISTLKTSYYELAEIFSAGELAGVVPDKAEDMYEPVTLAIYGNRKYVAYALIVDTQRAHIAWWTFGGSKNTKILRSIEHGMNRCPIRILAGKTGMHREPGEHWRSVLHEVRHMIPQLDRRASEAATASYASVMPWLKAKLNPAADPEKDVGAKIKELLQQDLVALENADPASGTAAEDLEAIHIPPFGKENVELIGLLRDTIRDETGAHEALSGGALAASMPAWSLNQITEQAKSRLKELTTAIVAAHVDHAETLMAAVQAFGEEIPLMRTDDRGGTVVLKPEELDDWVPRLKGEYKLQAPVSQIAMIQTGIQAMVQIKQYELPIDMMWVMQVYLDIEQPFEMFKHSEITRFLTSPKMMQWRMTIMEEEADVELAGDEGMDLEEYERMAAGLLSKRPGVNATIRGEAARSAARAGAPLSALPGGTELRTRPQVAPATVR